MANKDNIDLQAGYAQLCRNVCLKHSLGVLSASKSTMHAWYFCGSDLVIAANP